jgi:hypothetical protein
LCDEFNGEIAILKNPIKEDSGGNDYNEIKNFLIAGFKDNTDLVISKIRNCDDNMMPHTCKILPSTGSTVNNLGLVSRKLRERDNLVIIFFYLKKLIENPEYSLCSRKLIIDNFEEEEIFSEEYEFDDCPLWNISPANLRYFVIPEKGWLDQYYRAYFIKQDISEQDISEQDISEQDISEQDISEQDISEQDKLNHKMKIDYSLINKTGTFTTSEIDESSVKFDIVPIRFRSEDIPSQYVTDWLFVMLLKSDEYNDSSKSFSIQLKLFQAPHLINKRDNGISKTIITQKIDENLEFNIPCDYDKQLFLTEMSCIDLITHNDKFYMIMTVSNENSLSSPNKLIYMTFLLDLNLKPYCFINGLGGFIFILIFIISLFLFLEENYREKVLNKLICPYSIFIGCLILLFYLIEPIRNYNYVFALIFSFIIAVSLVIEVGRKKKEISSISEFHPLRYE